MEATTYQPKALSCLRISQMQAQNKPKLADKMALMVKMVR